MDTSQTDKLTFLMCSTTETLIMETKSSEYVLDTEEKQCDEAVEQQENEKRLLRGNMEESG